MTSLRILAVASEIFPIIKTGGLADVVGALPIALRAHGIETRTLVPGYPDVIKALPTAEVLLELPNFYGGPIHLLGGSHEDLDLIVLDAPQLFARSGNPMSRRTARIGPTTACACGTFTDSRRNRSGRNSLIQA
jgi:starch synthase